MTGYHPPENVLPGETAPAQPIEGALQRSCDDRCLCDDPVKALASIVTSATEKPAVTAVPVEAATVTEEVGPTAA